MEVDFKMRKTIELGNIDIDLTCQLVQLFNVKRYNWIAMDLLKLYTEVSGHIGEAEIELYILGFGIRVYWIYDSKAYNKKIKEWDKSLDKSKKGLKRKKKHKNKNKEE